MQRDTQTPLHGRTVTCPCCQGETKLEIDDSDQPGGILIVSCNHCIGGRVPAEVDEHSGALVNLPHRYVPDVSHFMGDCAVCGHTQSSPVHV